MKNCNIVIFMMNASGQVELRDGAAPVSVGGAQRVGRHAKKDGCASPSIN